jgi:hypothetical protein
MALLPVLRAIVKKLPEAHRRPETPYVFCRALKLEGDWGVVELLDIVPRSHPAVRAHPEQFEDTSIGVRIEPNFEHDLAHELEVRPRRV